MIDLNFALCHSTCLHLTSSNDKHLLPGMITSLRSKYMTSSYLIAYADFRLSRQIMARVCDNGTYSIYIKTFFKSMVHVQISNERQHEISNKVVCATSTCTYPKSDQSLCLSLDYSMSVKLLTEYHFMFLRLKGGSILTSSSESTLVKMPHC